MNAQLEKKIERAIKLIQSAAQQSKLKGQTLEIAYSGGKDSDVILELDKMAKVKFEAKYRNTTIDPKGTIQHCKENKVEILRPKKTFLQCIETSGYPTMFKRHCCGFLKEYKVNDVVVIGVRRSESKKRAERYKEPTECRFYDRHKKKVEMMVQAFYPILDWDDEDIKSFIISRKIKVHPLYYDENGLFHVERRLGCVGCPLIYKKKRIEQFKANPNMVKLWIRGGRKYLLKHKDDKNSSVYKYFNGNVYEWFCMQLFCNSMDEFYKMFGSNMFEEKIDCKTFLENYFNIKFKD